MGVRQLRRYVAKIVATYADMVSGNIIYTAFTFSTFILQMNLVLEVTLPIC